MVKQDVYASAGFALELLARSRYHKQYPLNTYFHTEIFPALRRGQSRVYLTEQGVPTAMVTWAWLSEEVQQEVHSTGRALRAAEWTCGDRLFFNDWITPYGNIREVLHDMLHVVFPDTAEATSLRRNQDGSVRRINRWTGINVRRAEQSGAGRSAKGAAA
ncbi:toxin-activating lysine-acyltransferase [Tropicibacter naphthalenivorans]|uniref:RTX toxin-activating lysine-acyltransferase n=1 Tax=Tropicibacter naphthalenivorans TaxID=441103 RepID=A0A0P1GF56_9RHOB|nr:toxin-activating lysine-acyltransferase [Tropicibacter naphthalenivorans]CUH80085.1 Hemolysin-activating lysine-acyltransferase HlyC [Tropicibacter naphthalenivorans]SMC84512.1 RTX toxin acyltransferase family protein [Tropicibacter naphthalenivorans]